jgi:hypothetical protein
MSTEQPAAERDRTPYPYVAVVVAVVRGLPRMLGEHVEVPEKVA